MRIHAAFLSIGILGVAPLAMAGQPFNNHSFAVMESSVAFCVRTDPAAATQYQSRVTHFVIGMSEEKLTAARNSPEYKAAFASASAAMEGLSKEQALSTCAGLLKGGK